MKDIRDVDRYDVAFATTISCPMVHDVGYRHVLMSMPWQMESGCSRPNIEGDVEEEVLILANGGEQEIWAFEALVKQCDRNRLAAGFKASRELPRARAEASRRAPRAREAQEPPECA